MYCIFLTAAKHIRKLLSDDSDLNHNSTDISGILFTYTGVYLEFEDNLANNWFGIN